MVENVVITGFATPTYIISKDRLNILCIDIFLACTLQHFDYQSQESSREGR